MNWKIKAAIQNTLACLPDTWSQAAYYRVQRTFGSLQRIDPTSRLQAGIDTWDRLLASGAEPTGKTFFEVGTGRMLSVPIAFWLMGASRTITVDLNRYLRTELVLESLKAIAARRDHLLELFGDRLDASRFDRLVCLSAMQSLTIEELLAETGIEYHAPSDAANINLPDGAIDFHTSFTVFEHIPRRSIHAILVEAKRLLSDEGRMVHGVDYSDHFAHSDSSISAINFLRFDQRKWDLLSGNRYMYMNRLRHADYLEIINDCGFTVIHEESMIDERSLSLLEREELVVNETFESFSASELAKTFGWIVAAPQLEESPAVA